MEQFAKNTIFKGLLKYACRCDDPVLFFEHKGIYRQGFASSEEPDENYLLPFCLILRYQKRLLKQCVLIFLSL